MFVNPTHDLRRIQVVRALHKSQPENCTSSDCHSGQVPLQRAKPRRTLLFCNDHVLHNCTLCGYRPRAPEATSPPGGTSLGSLWHSQHRQSDATVPTLSFAPVYVLGSRETRALWKRLTQSFMLFTLPTPHFFRAGEGRGVLRNQKSAEVFKPLLHQSSFYKPLVIPTNISQQAASTAHIKPEKIP